MKNDNNAKIHSKRKHSVIKGNYKNGSNTFDLVDQSNVVRPLLSLCMPTNGISEWVFKSLKSIYDQHVDEDRFEVVIMDNGNNVEFKEKIKAYQSKHKNLKYFYTAHPLFLSEPESYKRATGELIKFVNHRNIMTEGSIEFFLEYAEKYRTTKPVIYFTNGMTRQKNAVRFIGNFGEFVKALEYYSTWSSGMAVWKSDMDIMKDYEGYNYLFPHTDILFARRDAELYIIDGTHLWDEQDQEEKPKGHYNVFYAFAVEFLYILLELVRNGDIDCETFLSIKKDNLDFLTQLYIDYIIKRKYCSYDLTGYKESFNVFYSFEEIYKNVLRVGGLRIINRFRKILSKN